MTNYGLALVSATILLKREACREFIDVEALRGSEHAVGR
jgi:hypothetical protein